MSKVAPDMALANRFLDARGPDDHVLHVGITGSHIYGFPSPDSDIDMKGIHVATTTQLLTLNPKSPPFDRLEFFEGVECDLTTHEVAHALSMLVKGNGNVLERILSPFQLRDSGRFEALQSLTQASVHRGFHNHYSGYFRGMQREHLLQRRAKTALYAYRVALTGARLLESGILETDVGQLSQEFGFPVVQDLVEFKSSMPEKATIADDLDALAQADWPRLQSLLDEAHASSSLPIECSNQAQLESWLLELRRVNWE